MLVLEKVVNQDFGLMAERREQEASLFSNEEIFIKIAKNIISNSTLTFNDKIMLHKAAIPRRNFILLSIQQLYALKQIEWKAFVLFDTYF